MPQYDQFDVALAGVPSDEERQRQVADRLRGQTGLGAYFQTLGDPMTAKAGANIQQTAEKQTSALQRTREEQDRLAAKKLSEDQDRALKEQLDAQEIPDYQMPTMGEQREDKQMMKEYQEITNLTNQFEDKFATIMTSDVAQLAAKTGELPIPGSRAFSNWLVNKLGFDDEESVRANQWWKNMNLMYNFPERYKLFGATLTGNEKSSWDKVAAGESMDPKAIRLLLDQVNKRISTDVRQEANIRRASNFSPDYYNTVFGDMAAPMTPEQLQEMRGGKIPTYEELGVAAGAGPTKTREEKEARIAELEALLAQ